MPEAAKLSERAPRPVVPVAIAASVTIAVVLASMVGGGLATLASVVFVLISSSVAPGLYLIGSLGLGVLLQRSLMARTSFVWSMRAGLGLAAMLTVTHLMGILGVLTFRGVALVPVIVGVAVIARELHKLRRKPIEPRASWVWLASVPALGVLLVAACSPPGWLWASEFGGYDALSYHLQLPQEWLAMGRVWPVEHNVYAYLPSYMEAAFLHVGVLMGAGQKGLTTGDGSMLVAAQLLHAGIAIIAAVLTTSAARALLERTGAPRADLFAPIAGAFVLATPWAVVTGSMAYNEMAVVAFFAAGLLAALSGDVLALRRGVIVGLLVGAACGCKPTALLFCAPACGLALLCVRPKQAWVMLTLGACIGGLLMIAPWLVRNAMAGGNPVFPQLSGLFGSAHWSVDQVARYREAHAFEGGLIGALRLLVLPEADGTHRGILHPQWAFFGPIVLVALGVALGIMSSHRMAALLAAMLIMQLGAWLTLTHVQSRFLIPMLVPGSIAVALALSRVSVTRLGLTLGFLCVLVQSLASITVFLSEKSDFGGPNTATLFGQGLFADAPEDAPDDQIGPVAFINDRLPEGSKVLIVGDAAVLYIRRPVAYATTWDTSPLAEAMRAHGDDPSAWGPTLRAQGITHVSIDTGELDRLSLSGWSDPLLDAGLVIRWLADHAHPVYKDEQGKRLIYELP